MITNIDKSLPKFVGLSTDTKPSQTVNGSLFVEQDTGKVYLYDLENDTWYEQPESVVYLW